MDPHISPRNSRRRRYDSCSLLQHLPDPNYAPYRYPTFTPLPPHPSVSPLLSFPRNHSHETHRRFVHPGDVFYYLSREHVNLPGFDRPNLPFPRVSDPAIYHSLPHGKSVLPVIWKRSRGGCVTLEKPGVFEEMPRRSQLYENSFTLGDSGPGPMDMSRLQSEQDRFLGDVSDWRYPRQLRFLDARENHCHDPCFEQLSQEAASLATEPPPLYSPRGLRRSGSVSNRCGNYSRVFVHCPPRSPLSSDRYFSDVDVVSSTEAMLGDSQVIGNGLEPQRGLSIYRKTNCVDLTPDRGFEGSQNVEYKPIKKSDPSNVANEIGFSNSHMVRKTHNIPRMDYKPKLEEDCSIGNKGKRKMSNDRNAKFHACSGKRPIQKPSAFSRIQSGLSVWDRLEEKPLILCQPPSCPPPPRISNETEAKVDILDLPIKPNAVLSKAVDPLNFVPSSIKEDLSVEKPVEIPNIVMKKKMSKVRRQVKTPTISVDSSAKQGVGKISNVCSSGSVLVQAEANKVKVSKDAAKMLCNKKVKKLAVGKNHETKKAAKIFCQVDGCKFGCGETYVMETNVCIPNGDANGKLVNDGHLQLCQKGQLMRMPPTRDASGKNITKTENQGGDHVIETLDNSGGEPSELEKTFDNRFISLLVSDALVLVNATSSQPINKLRLNNAATQDFSLNMDENYAANSSKQIKLEAMDSVNSIPLKIEQEMPTADSATPADTLGMGEVFNSTGSRTLSYIDHSVNCNNIDIEIERQVKMQGKMEIFAAPKESKVSGKYFSSQPCLHGLQDLSFAEFSSAAVDQKLLSEGTVKENNEFNLPSFNLIPQSDYNLNSGDNSGSLRIDADGVQLEQSFLLGSMKMNSSDLFFRNTLLFRQCSDSMEFINNTSTGNEEKERRAKSEACVRNKASLASESVQELGKIIKNQKLISQKSHASPSMVLNKQVHPNAKTDEEFSCKHILPQYAISKFLSRTTRNSGQLKDVARTCQAGRHRTWIRANTHLHSDENQKRGRISSNQAPKKLVKIHNSSYIRKGNSLIRNLAAKPPVLLPGFGATSRIVESIPEKSSLRERIGEFPDNAKLSHPLFERPKTPPLPPPSKLSDCTMYPCKEFPLTQVVMSHEPVTIEGKQHDSPFKGLAVGNLWSQDTASCKGVEIVKPKNVTYVKQKNNQLAAAPGSKTDDSSNFFIEPYPIPVRHPTGTSKILPFSSSYLYYRSKRNQLIRSVYSSGSQVTGIPTCEANLIDLIQRGSALPLKRLDVHQKAKKPRKSSLVWRLAGDKLCRRSIGTLGCQMVFPYIFPWKRVVNQKSFIMNDRFPVSSRFPLSLISHKLQCLRKRDTIYKVSTDGFTLRKAGVVSIGGSNLKWSKSIEKRSKKASEEATLAVAEVERNKRERKKSKSTHGNGKTKHGLTRRSACTGKQGHARERIFRVGSARYKMDASKRTLIRIADDHSSSTSQQPETNSLKTFIPRRLIIGNDEYVRIGNGNQLVRDPKKLQRILASEKVRWSLHTARLKLAKKCQYCLFFTRFGKCNKSEGKCPYIHDSSKVSICTNFVRGQCSDSNCKLTHKVIQERMPDCSYFLKGECTNINCPYRHVKVNANAPLCDGFLRGHCADGDECRKKHSYTCPIFESTGSCPHGSLCKLGHPKSQSKSRKRKRTKLNSNSQGRYFFSSIGKASKPLSTASSQNDLEDTNDFFCSDGRFTEYINLCTDSDDDIGSNVFMDSYPGKLACDDQDMKSCDLDAHIKPVQIMKRDDLAIFES